MSCGAEPQGCIRRRGMWGRGTAVRWAVGALLLARQAGSQEQLPEGQPCPSACADLSPSCPSPDEPAGEAPERYVGDPYSVPWPGAQSDPRCAVLFYAQNCCTCGGGSVPDGCPEGRELQLTVTGDNIAQWGQPDTAARSIGALAWRAERMTPDLLRRDQPRRVQDRVRVFSIAQESRQVLVERDEEDVLITQTIRVVVTFYFAAWYRWFPSPTDLENALALGVSERSGLELRAPSDSRPLPPLLRVAPPDTLRPYPNSIAYAEYQAGVGREEPVCETGTQPFEQTADSCPRVYTHSSYPPEQRDLRRNTTETSSVIAMFSAEERELVPGGRFVDPPCLDPHNRTWADERCPVEDTTYCDEFHSLDLDCDGVLSLSEAAETTTWFDEPSYHQLTPLSLVPNLPDSAFVRMSLGHQWEQLLAALDGDDDGYLSLFDWLKGSRVYKPTYRHCGEVLSDNFFRYIKQFDRSLGGANGAFPIQPCAACEMRWIYCELDMEGGGWNLVYEGVGKTDFLLSTGEVNVDRLFDPDFGTVAFDRYNPYRTEDYRGLHTRGPTLAGGRSPQGGKLDDASIRHLCDGQYMIYRKGQHPAFCRFMNISQYGDDAESVKACSFDHDAAYSGYKTLEPEPGSSFGFSTGVSASGVGTFGYVTQLGYLWGPGGYYTLASEDGSAAAGDADYGASSHWVSSDDPYAEFSYWKPVDRDVVSCHRNSERSSDCVATQLDPLRGRLAPSMYIEEQCLCSRQYTGATVTGTQKQFGYPQIEASWLNSNGAMSDQVRCIACSLC